MWLDHRASEEVSAINDTNHPLLQFVGGKISIEMEMPKILWLKKVGPLSSESVNLLEYELVTGIMRNSY